MAGHGGTVQLDHWELTQETPCNKFSCGERTIDVWFAKNAKKDHERGRQRVTCTSLAASHGVAGVYSLATVTERISHLPGNYWPFGGSDYFPCLQLVWLGVQREMQGLSIGKQMVGAVIETFASVGARIGLPHLILVPINDGVIEFYERLGFQQYNANGETRMFLPLQTAIAAFAE